MSDKIRIGLVGTGRIGRVHAQTLAQRTPGVALVAVTDVNTAAAQAVAQEMGVPHVAPSFDSILADDSIQAVVICSATDT
ncbi:MAG: Gfo/Idh/MocA family oxidoreductase, partial [Anaerolineae bacterium]|nr:Gfo/Idh/MocA family oxidoreductase [Anaerolineae bacterium]